jgi:flagellar hook-length control protein FliK
MEQSITDIISTNTVSNSIGQQKVNNDQADGDNADSNSLVPFLQLLNQQITALTPTDDPMNELVSEIGGKKTGNLSLNKDENINGLLKQNRNQTIAEELPALKALSDKEAAAVKSASEFAAKLKNQIFENEDSKNNASKLSDELLKNNNLKISDNQTITGNASKLSAGNIADKLGLANMEALQTFSADMVEKVKNTAKENSIVVDKNVQDVSVNLLSTTGNGMAKTSSIDDISSGQIINRIATEVKESASTDGGRVKLTLSPPSLGTLEMDVTVRNNKVEVVIVANNKDVQQTLNVNLDHLKTTLQNQGLTIDRCDVLMQTNREGYPQNFSQQAFYRDGSEKNSNTSKEKYSEESKPITSVTSQVIRSPLLNPDNISIFA